MGISPENAQAQAGAGPAGAEGAFTTHELEWTPERIGRFWAEYGEEFFSGDVAAALADWIVRRGASDPIVDVGCGRGDLLAELKKRGREVLGIDLPGENLRLASRRVPVRVGDASETNLETGSAGTVLLVETLEHVIDPDGALREAGRILKYGSPLIITTPNAEDLDRSKITCPECGARFHRMQHLRSWSAATLAATLRRAGFHQVTTETTRLPPGVGLGRYARSIKYRLAGDRQHLLAVARFYEPPAGGPTP